MSSASPNSALSRSIPALHEAEPPPSTSHGVSYVDSHKAPGKGQEYDAYYATTPEMCYLWGQEQQVLARILTEFYPGRPVQLLDFACGTGRITAFLEPKVACSCAVDVSGSMLALARKKLVRTRVLQADLLTQPVFPSGSFNLITAFRFFLNAEPGLRRAAIGALAPLLAEGGCFVFNIHQNRSSIYYALAGLYCKLRRGEPDTTLSIGECKRLLDQVGLKLCRVYSIGLLHLPKLQFSDATRQWVDRAARHWDALGCLSDSPILVARKKG